MKGQLLLLKRLDAPKTSIIATIGPSSFDGAGRLDRIPKLVEKGANIIRLNFSHFDVRNENKVANVLAAIRSVREVEARTKIPLGILVDIAGPKIRLGYIKPDSGREGIFLKVGDRFVLTMDPNHGIKEGLGTRENTSIKYSGDLCADIQRTVKETGRPQKITIDDGYIDLVVEEIKPPQIICRVLYGGIITSNKGVNIPGCKLSVPFITRKDLKDFGWLLSQQDENKRIIDDVDYIALSFVKEPRNIDAWVGGHLHPNHVDKLIISKIETIEAADHNFGPILDKSFAIMVARGDLGAEKPFEEVPRIQDTLIEYANDIPKPVIVATHMLESMRRNKRPTRAEVSDVSNAILSGADVVMLSGETSAGIDPVNAVEAMARICKRAEKRVECKKSSDYKPGTQSVIEAIAHPIVELAEEIGARAIVSITATGETAKYISKYRPHQPIIAVTHSRNVIMQLLLSRGVYPALVDMRPKLPDEKIRLARMVITEMVPDVRPDDLFVLSLGIHPERESDAEITNTIHVMRYG
jgi:pyruvate kinase